MAKILLVEDDINLREIYSARFSAESYQVITASDGEEALATAVRERPDLIVLDVMMPKISGFDVLDILRSTPETKETKVIMMTALSQEGDRQRGEALGANRYLVKSQVTLEDVVNVVKEELGGGAAPAAGTPPPVAPTPPPVPPTA
jgi:two-component system phosphate regulon response regulator PhoB